MKIRDLKCNGKRMPLQIDHEKVTFDWNLTASENAKSQNAYEIWVGQEEKTIWLSGKKRSEQCLYVPYEGPELKPDSRYEWRVQVWDQADRSSGWSHKSWFETDIGQRGWKAEWIGFDRQIGEPFNPQKPFYCADDFKAGKNEYYLPPVPYLRNIFLTADKNQIVSAKIYLTALGLVEVEINGKKIKQGSFSPGFSDYRKTVYTRAYHVEPYLKEGMNGIGIILADGWYAGYMGLNNREWYGSRPRVMLQLHIQYKDGKRTEVITHGGWKASYGPLLEADIFQGETYDANLEMPGWSEAKFDDNDWEPVTVGSETKPAKKPNPGREVVEHGHIIPAMIPKEKDRILLQFPAYVCGVCEFTVTGQKGSSFTVNHAEMLGADKELFLQGNRSARCQDTYILRGVGVEKFRPRFTYHGFRYAEIKVQGAIEFICIEGIQLGTELPQKTMFECSNDTANTVFQMIRATERANMLEIPMDCTARDERLGWGMEGNHFMYGMAYMNNHRDAILKWNQDIWDGQRADGALEAVAPAVVMEDIESYIGDLQSHHGIYMVHALYMMYGDIRVVKKYMERMKSYFAFLDRNSDRYLRYATSCDWLGILEATDHSDIKHGYGECSSLMIGTAHYAVVVRMMIELCEAVADPMADSYRGLLDKIKTAYRRNFIEKDGKLRRGKQGDYLMALYADLLPKEYHSQTIQYLRGELLKSGSVRWFGGTTTTPYFLKTLKRNGMVNLANQFITAVTYPSIGYMNTMGFDTIWERWDGIYEDGTIHPHPMNAMSHEGHAAIGTYFVTGIAGINAKSPGFKKMILEPGVSKEITYAKTRFYTPYGEVFTEWEWKEERFTLRCQIPVNTTAVIKIPYGSRVEFTKGRPIKEAYESGTAILEI